MSQAAAPGVVHRRLGGEEDGHQAGGRGDGDRTVARRLAQAVGERAGGVAEVEVGLLVEQRERGAAGGDRERVAAQRARLVDVAGRRDPLHQRRRAAEGRGRQAAADDLAHHGQVGQDARELLRAARGDAEAGDDLVEDEQRVVARAEVAQQLEEARARAGSGPCWPDRARPARPRTGARRTRGGRPRGRSTARPRCPPRRPPGRPARTGCPASPGRSRPGRAARRRGRGRRRRTSAACRGPSRRGRAGSRSSTPRCPRTSSAACRPTASAP